MVNRGFFGQEVHRNLGHHCALMEQAQLPVRGHFTDGRGGNAVALEVADDLLCVACFYYQEHALLGLGEHQLIGAHVLFRMGNQVQIELNPCPRFTGHFRGGGG